MPIKASPPADDQPNPYTPALPGPFLFEKFEGIQTQTTRPGVDEKRMAWCDGFIPLGPNRNLRTLYGIGAPIAVQTAHPVVFFQFANIGTTPYAVEVSSAGAIKVVNMNTLVVTAIAAAGTITNPSQLTVGMVSYGSKYVLIVAKQTNGYFAWDGTTFYNPGDPAPDGGTMPLGIGGTAIELYTGRVWIANGPTITFGAPGSVHDFSSANGGGNFTSADSFLRVGFTQLKQTNGFLYLIADSSINYISSVQTSGSPVVTTFTNQNADPEVGTPWPGTVSVFNRNIVFANAFGAHISYGGAVTKISEDLDGVYNTVPNFGNFVPTAAKAIIFGKKVWMLLLPIIDPVTGQQVNKLMMWNSKIWWTSGQDVALTYIQTQEINSVITAWGSDGLNIYQLFQQPSARFTKTVRSRLTDEPGGYQFQKATGRLWGMVQYYSSSSPNLRISIDNEIGANPKVYAIGPEELTWSNSHGVMTWSNSHGVMTWFSFNSNSITILPPEAVGQVGVLTGLTVKTESADMAIISLMMQNDIVQYRG